MPKNKTYHRMNVLILFSAIVIVAIALGGRLGYLMIFKSEDYAKRAKQLHERERSIKAERGVIYDRSGVAIAINKPVSTISVIHSQIKEPEKVIEILSKELSLSEEAVRKRVEKRSSIERVKSNVDKEIADKIREYKLAGVMVDEDYKRYYPYESLASKVIGFTGSDNQGIVGLEVAYETFLKGTNGTILTLTTASGVEIEGAAEDRIEPLQGNNLHISLDVNIQSPAEQIAKKVLEAKSANNVKVIVMNPQNGELYAMVNVPEFDLNSPYTLTDEILNGLDATTLSSEQKNDLLNNMWRNASISDTYEPGSTFKIITAAAAIEENVVALSENFYCPGHKVVEDRRIKCHKVQGHGSQTFIDGIKNSCNPVFMELGARLGINNFYTYFDALGLFKKTGVDVPGEARSIMHKASNVGAVELATISFGQSFQITPLQLLVATSAIINGGTIVTPHFGVEAVSPEGRLVKSFDYPTEAGAISKDTSETMKMLLEAVVSEGTGKRAYLPGFQIGGKTATSEKLPRSSNKYISSFIGFAPADNPQVIAIVLIDEPVGIYYGGTIAAPVISELFDNILPYLGVEPRYTESEIIANNIGDIAMPNLIGMTKKDVSTLMKAFEFDNIYYLGEGDVVVEQFPLVNDLIPKTSDIIVYLE